ARPGRPEEQDGRCDLGRGGLVVREESERRAEAIKSAAQAFKKTFSLQFIHQGRVDELLWLAAAQLRARLRVKVDRILDALHVDARRERKARSEVIIGIVQDFPVVEAHPLREDFNGALAVGLYDLDRLRICLEESLNDIAIVLEITAPDIKCGLREPSV